MSSEVGFCKCEVISIPPHPFKGFQRPLHLFTKAGEPSNEVTNIPNRRERRKCEKLSEAEKIKYECELFPKNTNKGSMSEISQQSGDLSQYEQLENVYAPSTTPCYDTPSHNNEHHIQDTAKMCYVDVDIRHDKDTEMGEADKTREKDKETEETKDIVDKVHDDDKEIRKIVVTTDNTGSMCSDEKKVVEMEEVKDKIEKRSTDEAELR